ncbi:MAG: hypothetical protein NT167_07075 [Verrucomicrobia bacterium]|nr:hypothetical protein [Verrucomicrobiota bacterium]
MNIPFTPAVYEHAARFVGRTPSEVSRDAEILFQAHRGAYLEYRHQPIAVGIDIYNLEAEAYGAKVEQMEGDAIPAIYQPLLKSLEEGMALQPFRPERDGRIAMVLGVGQRLKREFPEADVRIPVAGPFSVAFNLRGINPLCEDVADRPEAIAQFLWHLAENQAVLCRAWMSPSSSQPPRRRCSRPVSFVGLNCPPCGTSSSSPRQASATPSLASWAATRIQSWTTSSLPAPVTSSVTSRLTNRALSNPSAAPTRT